jgi:hypothetical protein
MILAESKYQTYTCSVEGFAPYNTLYVKANSDAESFYIVFNHVQYLQCPMRWVGANLLQLPDNVCMTLVRQLGLLEAENFYRLWQFPDAPAEARILAVYCSMSDKV